jgi:hypothetical protein
MLQLLEAQAAGQRIGVSAQRIRQLVRAHRLSPYAITTRGGVLFRERDLQRFADEDAARRQEKSETS